MPADVEQLRSASPPRWNVISRPLVDFESATVDLCSSKRLTLGLESAFGFESAQALDARDVSHYSIMLTDDAANDQLRKHVDTRAEAKLKIVHAYECAWSQLT